MPRYAVIEDNGKHYQIVIPKHKKKHGFSCDKCELKRDYGERVCREHCTMFSKTCDFYFRQIKQYKGKE